MITRISFPLSRRLARRPMIAALALAITLASAPAAAQWTVFDPSNYSQNLMTAARSLQQINNQIQSLQNQATMLTNMAKNLSHIDFPELQALRATLQQIDTLMGRAKAIEYQVGNVDTQFRQMFPTSFNAALTSNDHVAAAKARMDASMSAYQETMGVHASIKQQLRSVNGRRPTLRLHENPDCWCNRAAGRARQTHRSRPAHH